MQIEDTVTQYVSREYAAHIGGGGEEGECSLLYFSENALEPTPAGRE